MKEITIELGFVTLPPWVGKNAIVACLFAAGHIPALISIGYGINAVSSLILDVGMGLIILPVVSKSEYVWWFSIVLFTLDMTQYY